MSWGIPKWCSTTYCLLCITWDVNMTKNKCIVTHCLFSLWSSSKPKVQYHIHPVAHDAWWDCLQEECGVSHILWSVGWCEMQQIVLFLTAWLAMAWHDILVSCRKNTTMTVTYSLLQCVRSSHWNVPSYSLSIAHEDCLAINVMVEHHSQTVQSCHEIKVYWIMVISLAHYCVWYQIYLQNWVTLSLTSTSFPCFVESYWTLIDKIVYNIHPSPVHI